MGFDPTAPDLHLGHTVLIRKMKHFQDLGHTVVFVVGDFTGMIGDPTGRSKTRPPLTRRDRPERRHLQGAGVQAARSSADSLAFNSQWLTPLGSDGLIRLAARYNVAQMLERREFRQRFDSGQPIAVHEFLYPLAQAYDSVALKADVELGGTDQLFNLNVGRDIMPAYGLEPQIVMTTPLLEGLDGVEKMSKSLGNYVGVTDPPGEMFGKLMSISDELMWRYYLLLTEMAPAAVEALRRRVADGYAASKAGQDRTRRTHRGRISIRARRRRSAASEFVAGAQSSGGFRADLRETPVAFPDGSGLIAHARSRWMWGWRRPRATRDARFSRAECG